MQACVVPAPPPRGVPVTRRLLTVADMADIDLESDSRSGPTGRRVALGATGGAVAAALAVIGGASWSVAALAAEGVSSLVFLIGVWTTIARADASVTSRLARREDASRAAAEAVLIGAGAGSL